MDIRSIDIQAKSRIEGNTVSLNGLSIPTTDFRVNTVSLSAISIPLIEIRGISTNVSLFIWDRACSEAEINQLHNNNNLANPLLYNPYKVDGKGQNSQSGLVVAHIANKDLLYDDGGVIKIKNLADDSGLTDGVCQDYESLNEAYLDSRDFRELRLNTEIL